MAVLCPGVAVGGICRQPLTGHPLITEYGPNLLACVLRVPLIYDVAKRCEVIRALIFAVHAVIDGNESNAHLGKADLRIKSNLQIVSAKPGHILDHDHADQSRLNVPQHFLKPRTLEAGAGVPVVLVNFVLGDAMVSGVLGQDFNLRSDLSRANSPSSIKIVSSAAQAYLSEPR